MSLTASATIRVAPRVLETQVVASGTGRGVVISCSVRWSTPPAGLLRLGPTRAGATRADRTGSHLSRRASQAARAGARCGARTSSSRSGLSSWGRWPVAGRSSNVPPGMAAAYTRPYPGSAIRSLAPHTTRVG